MLFLLLDQEVGEVFVHFGHEGVPLLRVGDHFLELGHTVD
jgi:hypothetical protein